MNRKTFWLLIGILIIATFLRTYHLKTIPPGLYPDEAMNGSNALEALRTHHFKIFYPENNGREGLFMNIQALFVAALGREPWVLRLPSAIFGVMTVLGLFFFSRELMWGRKRDEYAGMPYADRIGLLASFFLATSFWHINFSRIGFRAITASFFLVWALYFFLRALHRNDSGRTTSASAIMAGVFFGLGFYSYIAFRVMPLLFLIFIPFYRKQPRFWKITGVFVAAVFIVAAPIGWYFLTHPADFFGRTTQVAVTAASHPFRDLVMNTVKTLGMIDVRGDGNWRHNFSGRPEVFWPVGIFFWMGILLTFTRRNRKEKLPFLVLFGWFFFALLPVVISDEGIPHALRSILLVLPIMSFAAVGADWAYEKTVEHFHHRGQRTTLRAAALLLFALLFLEAYHTYFVLWAKNTNVPGAFSADYAAIGNTIRALPDDIPKYVFIEAGGGTVALKDPFDGGEGTHNVPIPAQTVMFLTDSFSPERQAEHNIHYVVPGDTVVIPDNAQLFHIK
jgi:4-amino-4-deoxy-L-arabinose transferase-like glycosyltransferase